MCATNPSGLVLVVEDELLLRDVIATDLKDAGWDVLEASTGECAIGIIQANPHIDVLFTDIQLAGRLSGWDVAEAFRAAKPEMLVIYTSGNSADRSRAVANSQFFSKPYRAPEILKACRRRFER
jgi:CheY-like chemotaxis protein